MDEALKKQIEEMSEIYIWGIIEECGGFIWRMNHDMADGRIPEEHHAAIDKDIVKMREIQIHAKNQLPRFGIEDPLSSKEAQDKYWEWYQSWKSYMNGLSNEEWNKLNTLMAENSPEADNYRPEELKPPKPPRIIKWKKDGNKML